MPPSTDGRWSAATPFNVADQTLRDGVGHSVTDDRGLFVLHAVLMHTGKVLCFGGHVENAFYPPLSYVFDPKRPGDLLRPMPFPPGMDLFCCHYTQVQMGRICVVGGSDKDFRHHGSVGAKNIAIFDPSSETWGDTHNHLLQGRWYPTPVLMPDWRMMVVSGRPEHGVGTAVADKVEMLRPPRREPRELTGASATRFPIYPGLHLAPDGKVYWTSTTWGQEIANPDTASIEVPDGANSASWVVYAGRHPAQPRREEGMSVLLPLTGGSSDGDILVIGGTTALQADGTPVMQGPGPFGAAVFDHIADANDCLTAEILKTSVSPPTWSKAPSLRPAAEPSMNRGRTNGHAVLLPDETVLICGGHNGYKWQASSRGTIPSLEAEIFTPGSGFRLITNTPAEEGDRMHRPRMYHSVALLLPDGRVFVAGGANPNEGEPLLLWPLDWGGTGLDPDLVLEYDAWAPVAAPAHRLGYAGQPLNDKTFEIYEPPYCFQPDNASRPVITDVRRSSTSTRRIRYGQSFTIVTPQASSINRVAIMRPGAPTHHTDTEQRYVRLNDFTRGTGELTVTMESSARRAPPGFYMLWIVDTTGRPCQEAPFVHVVP